MQKILFSLFLAASVPAFGQVPQTKSETVEARYCPKPSEDENCSKVEITRLIFDNPAHTAFSDRLLRDNVSDLELPDFEQGRLQRELEKAVNETKDENGYLRLEYHAENILFGYSPDYLTIKNVMWVYGGGPHGNGGDYFSTIPRQGKPAALKTEDILLPGKTAAFVAAVKEGLAEYYMEAGEAKNRQEAFDALPSSFDQDYKNADFNWTPDKGGLYFVFNPYSLGSYLATADFTLPADKLRGIVKPEFLKQLELFEKTAKDLKLNPCRS